jgi:heat shock protein HslJ
MKLPILFVVLTLLAAACGSEDPAGSPGSTPDGDWVLTGGIDLVDGFPITMSIEGSEVSGRAACNSYSGTVTVDGARLTIGEIGATEMGCQPAVMAAESAFIAALLRVVSFDRDGDRLTLSGPEIALSFEPVTPVPTAALIATTWVLDSLIEGETVSTVGGDPATLVLAEDGTLTASTGCRTLTGTWLERGGVIVVPTLSAEGECPDELWKQDSLVVTVIGDEFRAAVDGDRLTLTSMGGDGLGYLAES